MEMDCAVEESEIRRALEGMAGIAQLQFALPQRALRIDADDAAVQQALAAIRRLGYNPKPLAVANAAAQSDCSACELPADLPNQKRMVVQMGAGAGAGGRDYRHRSRPPIQPALAHYQHGAGSGGNWSFGLFNLPQRLAIIAAR